MGALTVSVVLESCWNVVVLLSVIGWGLPMLPMLLLFAFSVQMRPPLETIFLSSAAGVLKKLSAPGALMVSV